MAVYPKKLFYKIQEVAEIVGVEPYVLRYWETKFPMVQPDKDAKDQRRYRYEDLEVLLRIRGLLYEEKYTIAGAVEKVRTEFAKGGMAAAKPENAPPPKKVTPAPTPPPVDDELPFLLEESTDDPRMTGPTAEKLQELRDEFGLLKREIEQWREELGEG